MNGIDWMKVNATKILKADTIEIFLDSIEANYENFRNIIAKKNEMIKSVKCNKLIIHLGKADLKNVPQVGHVKFDGGLFKLDEVVFAFKNNKFQYSNPDLLIRENKLSFRNKPLFVKEVSYSNKKLLIKNVFYQDKSIQFLADLKSISTQVDIENIGDDFSFNAIKINAKKIEIQDDLKTIDENESIDFSIKNLRVNSEKVTIFSSIKKSIISVVNNLSLTTKDLVIGAKSHSYGFYNI